MIAQFIDKEIPYTGKELSSHWAFRNFDILGDSIVSFIGPCDVTIDHMADLVDVKKNAPIKSDRMLHLIVEHFGSDLQSAVLRQRLLICILLDVLNQKVKTDRILRKGDDLYRHDAKLSVSIAVKTPVSCMIHVGLNVVNRGTPVKTLSLEDLNIDPQELAGHIMQRYQQEIQEMNEAQWKVRGVP